jgi:hypothetical protein
MRFRSVAGASTIAATAWLIGSSAIVRGQPAAGTNAHRAPQSIAEFEQWQKDVSNWGRWGKDDEVGTMNLVTDAKRRDAAKLVKTGHAISLAHTLITEAAPDLPSPPGQAMGPFEMTGGGNTFKISFHSTTHSHVDALCQFDYQGQIYNGFKISDVKGPRGCTKEGMELVKVGFTTRGVLIDIPWLRNVPYLEPGTPVYQEDVEAFEKKTGVKVQPGDAIFLRTGRWARRAKVGPWDLIPRENSAGEAGYHVSTVPWMRKRDVAIVAADVSNDVRPSGVPKEVLDRVRSMPVHSLVIVSLGGYIVDAVDLEELSEYCAKTNRWEFMVTGAGMAAAGGTGSPLSLTAIF